MLLCSTVLLAVASAALSPLEGKPPKDSSASPAGEELWVEPTDLASRDLFHGPGGRELLPKDDVEFRFKSLDTKGHSRGYDVEDPGGRKWDVKTGEEAQAEVVASRLLWAIGYHQPVVYYVEHWRMKGGPKKQPEPGRFRLASDHKTEGSWSWHENPFVGTRPFRGLAVACILLNNWDLTKSNTRIYRKNTPKGHTTWYVVQDLGGSLGKTRITVGTRNSIEDFEREGFVKGVENDRVKFEYHGRHRFLLKDITTGDVVWTCRLLAQLSDRQLRDAFRAAGYSEDVSARFIRKIKQKIQEGLALERSSPEAASSRRSTGSERP